MLSSASFSYVESDVPEGMTLTAWRTADLASRPRRRLRLPRLAGGLTPHPAG